MVWGKGVATPASVPTPTPTPLVTPGAPQKNLTPLEKLNLDIYNRYLVADNRISPSFNFVSCPGVNQFMVKITQDAYIDAYSFWASIYKAKAKINWLLMSEKDWDCWYETTAQFEGPNSVSRSWSVWNENNSYLGHCFVNSSAFCGYETGVQPGGIFAQYNIIGSDYNVAPNTSTVHHETVHNCQSQLIADNFATSKVQTMACWFMDGQANLFGVPIAYKGDSTINRNFEIRRLLKVYPNGSSFIESQWLKVFNSLKIPGNFCFDNELGYSLGWFALEWTYLNYSIEEMHGFLDMIAKRSTWDQAIQAIMKMDEQAYLSKIAKYFADEF